MNKTVLAVFSLAVGIASAQESNETAAEETDAVDLRVSVLEVIDVTADKTSTLQSDEPNEDIDAILKEAEALEDEEISE